MPSRTMSPSATSTTWRSSTASFSQVQPSFRPSCQRSRATVCHRKQSLSILLTAVVQFLPTSLKTRGGIVLKSLPTLLRVNVLSTLSIMAIQRVYHLQICEKFLPASSTSPHKPSDVPSMEFHVTSQPPGRQLTPLLS